MCLAEVVVLLIRALAEAVKVAAIATVVRPAQAALHRDLDAALDAAAAAAAVQPAVAVALRLAHTVVGEADRRVAALEASVVELGPVRATLECATRAAAAAHAAMA